MPIYKRGKTYWFHFHFNGEHIQKSTKQGNPRVARQIEAAHRTALAKGEVGIVERKPAPTLMDFSTRFMEAIQVRCADKPATVEFYGKKLGNLLRFDPLKNARLDKIDEALIETFVQYRSKQVSPASVNRELATLRRLLRLAHEWRVLERVPRIRLLPGERVREFVLNHKQEALYLEDSPQPLRDVATVLLDTGMRVGELLALKRGDVHLLPVNGARFGYILIRKGKSLNAKRNLCITERARVILGKRLAQGGTPWVFENEPSDGPLSISTLHSQHSRIRSLLGFSKEFVLHSLRHTMLTRLGEAGVEAFTIMRIAGHSSVTVSQRYVHPTPEALERAFERLEVLNGGETVKQLEGHTQQPPATVSATIEGVADGQLV